MKKLTLLITVLFMVFTISYGQDLQIHGFISQGAVFSTEYNYIADDSKDLSLDFQEIGINFQTDVSDNLHLGMQLLSRDVGPFGEGRVVIDWAYGDYYITDAFQVAFGRVKNKKGFYTDIQDFDFLRTWAVLPTALYDFSTRTISATVDGFQVHGLLDANAAGSFDYNISFGTMKLGTNSDLALFTNNDYLKSATTKYSLNALVTYNTPVPGLRLSGTVAQLKDVELNPLPQSMDLTSMGMGVLNFENIIVYNNLQYLGGAQYTSDKFEITTEFTTISSTFAMNFSGLSKDVMQALGLKNSETDTDSYGGYLGLSYKLNQKFALGGYYQIYIANKDFDDDDPTKKRNDTALSLAWYPEFNMIVKLEGHFVDGQAGVSMNINDELDAETWMYGVAKVSYSF